MASTIWIRAFLAEGRMQMGSRLKAACTNPQNSQPLNAPNAILSGSIEADLDTYLMARRFKDGYVVTATSALVHPTTERKATSNDPPGRRINLGHKSNPTKRPAGGHNAANRQNRKNRRVPLESKTKRSQRQHLRKL